MLVVDALVDETCIAAAQVVAKLGNIIRCASGISSSKSMQGQTLVTKGIGILNLIKDINGKTSHLNKGEIVAYSDI